jgi:hypothetical protein
VLLLRSGRNRESPPSATEAARLESNVAEGLYVLTAVQTARLNGLFAAALAVGLTPFRAGDTVSI